MQQILIVDDDEKLRQSLCELLDHEGYKTTQAANGTQAIKSVEDKTVDLIVCDILMPEKDGFETILHLKKKHPAIKIIAMSGGGRIEPEFYLQSAKILGISKALKKPFKSLDFLKAVEEALASGNGKNSLHSN